MIVNALLVRWHGGWAERTDAASITANGRREALLTLGAAQSITEADRLADAELARFAATQVEVTVGVEPIDDDDTPYLGFEVGDTITVPDRDGSPVSRRVVAVTVTEDEDGRPIYTPELGEVIL